MNNEPIFVRLGKTAAETHQMMQKVYGDNSLSLPTIYEQFKRFKEGREDLNENRHSSQLRSVVDKENVEIVRGFIKKSRNLCSNGPNGQCCR